MTVADVRAVLDRAAAELAVDELPDLVGVLAAASARAELRLRAPAAPPAAKPAQTLVSVEEMAQRCGLSVYWLREQAKAVRIPAHRAGRRMLFDPEATVAAIKALATKAKPRRNGRQDKRSWEHRRQKGRTSARIAPEGGAARSGVGHELSTAVAADPPVSTSDAAIGKGHR